MKLPNFKYESKLWKQDYGVIAGIDEVGRGCFAGPVVAGCVVFSNIKLPQNIKINDSKKLKPREREQASHWIKENSLSYGIGISSVSEINKHGIKKATEIAFRRAILDSEVKIEYLLIDAFYIPFVKGIKRKNQLPIIKGDNLSISIASASIIAKVYRDKLMRVLSKKENYVPYSWGRNKGYGTREHQKAIKEYGLTRHHRKQFVAKFI